MESLDFARRGLNARQMGHEIRGSKNGQHHRLPRVRCPPPGPGGCRCFMQATVHGSLVNKKYLALSLLSCLSPRLPDSRGADASNGHKHLKTKYNCRRQRHCQSCVNDYNLWDYIHEWGSIMSYSTLRCWGRGNTNLGYRCSMMAPSKTSFTASAISMPLRSVCVTGGAKKKKGRTNVKSGRKDQESSEVKRAANAQSHGSRSQKIDCSKLGAPGVRFTRGRGEAARASMLGTALSAGLMAPLGRQYKPHIHECTHSDRVIFSCRSNWTKGRHVA